MMAYFLFTISLVWALTIVGYTPAWNNCSAGTTPLSIFLCPHLFDLRTTPGVSRNFSALRLCNRSHPFVFNSRASLTIVFVLPLRCCTTFSRSPFLVCIVSTMRGPFAWWNRLDSNQHGPRSACFTLILPPECAITSLFHICPVCYAGRCFEKRSTGRRPFCVDEASLLTSPWCRALAAQCDPLHGGSGDAARLPHS